MNKFAKRLLMLTVIMYVGVYIAANALSIPGTTVLTLNALIIYLPPVSHNKAKGVSLDHRTRYHSGVFRLRYNRRRHPMAALRCPGGIIDFLLFYLTAIIIGYKLHLSQFVWRFVCLVYPALRQPYFLVFQFSGLFIQSSSL